MLGFFVSNSSYELLLDPQIDRFICIQRVSHIYENELLFAQTGCQSYNSSSTYKNFKIILTWALPSIALIVRAIPSAEISTDPLSLIPGL